MTDYFTAWEKFGGNLKGRKIAYVGDGNNMAHSLLFGAPKAGMHISVATPPGYAPDPAVVDAASADARAAGTRLVVTTSIEEAVKGADVVETDVWASMGQEDETEKRHRDFAGWIVDERVMSLANKGAIFMHCLPAHRGEEVSDAVLEGPQSRVWDEAENRLHVQKALMAALMGQGAVRLT